jgi:repressor LexA
MKLSTKQRAVLYFIDGYAAENRVSPTLYEIQEAFGWKSLNSVVNHVRALELKGYVRRIGTGARALQVIKSDV